jgi:hypothetical protein
VPEQGLLLAFRTNYQGFIDEMSLRWCCSLNVWERHLHFYVEVGFLSSFCPGYQSQNFFFESQIIHHGTQKTHVLTVDMAMGP